MVRTQTGTIFSIFPKRLPGVPHGTLTLIFLAWAPNRMAHWSCPPADPKMPVGSRYLAWTGSSNGVALLNSVNLADPIRSMAVRPRLLPTFLTLWASSSTRTAPEASIGGEPFLPVPDRSA